MINIKDHDIRRFARATTAYLCYNVRRNKCFLAATAFATLGELMALAEVLRGDMIWTKLDDLPPHIAQFVTDCAVE